MRARVCHLAEFSFSFSVETRLFVEISHFRYEMIVSMYPVIDSRGLAV